MRTLPLLLAAFSLFLALSFAQHTSRTANAMPSSTLNRPSDPVVLTGASLPSFVGNAPGDIVAFRYSGGWQQIPVQVDERLMRSFAPIYNGQIPLSMNVGPSQLVYADTGTYTGADTNATFDADDELVFMAKDAGGQPASFSEPAGIIAASGIELTITDPLNPAQMGWVYLFRQNGSLSPGAGQQYVNYTFSLNSGPYLTTYDFVNPANGPSPGNPENSTVTSAYYSRHFSDRWADDQLRIATGGATNVDILDRHKAAYAPGNCARSEDTFDLGGPDGFPGEGAFIANRVGPVRAIRSYIGANSGPNTQREHIFYERREEMRTFLRVHPIGSIADFFDYSPAASGMTYYNDLNTVGATIDGNPESLALGPIQWQMVTGAQGSLTISGTVATDIPGFSYTSYYLDDSTPAPVAQCTGDAFAYGSSGVFFDPPGDILCTDPGRNFNCPSSGPVYYLNATYNLYFGAPGMTVAGAQALDANAKNPLTVTKQEYHDPLGACAYDLNDSGKVSAADLLIFAQAYNSRPGDPYWNPAADFNGDNVVRSGDLLLFAFHYLWSTTACP